MIQAGAAEMDITPAPGLPMWGMPGSPVAAGVLWPLHARAVVFGDGAQRAAVVGLDLGALATPVASEIRKAAAEAVSMAPADIMLACSHTHNGPFTASVMEEDTNWEYVDLLRDRVVALLREASACARLCGLRAGRTRAPGLAFNRRTIYQGDGELLHAATVVPRGGPRYLEPEGPEDDELQVLLAEDADGRPVAGILNFSCHPTLTGGVPAYSPDFVGPLVDALRASYGCPFAYLTGAAGNLSPYALRPGEPLAGGEEAAQALAATLADRAVEAIGQAEVRANDAVRTASATLTVEQRRPTREQVALARWYLEEAPRDLDQRELTRRMSGHDYTFFSNTEHIQRWIARETIGLWEWQRQVGTRTLEEELGIQAIAVGEVAFVGFPVEYFTEYGLELKAASPFPVTLVAELANGWHGYVPTRQAFEHGGYETRLGYHSRLVPEAGDRMRDAAVGLLRRLAAGKVR